MAEKKQKQKSESVFRSVIEKRSSIGDLQGQVIVELSPWTFTNEKSGKVSNGMSLRIRVDKFGYGSQPGKSSFVTLDVSDQKVRKAIEEAYSTFDTID